MATTADDVWRLLGELAAAQKETERRFQKTDRQFQEADHQLEATWWLIEQQNRPLNKQLGKWGK